MTINRPSLILIVLPLLLLVVAGIAALTAPTPQAPAISRVDRLSLAQEQQERMRFDRSRVGLVTAIKNNPELSFYYQALIKSKQLNRLKTKQQLTVFAPDNEAIGLNRGIYDKLLANKRQLRQVVKYTIVDGRVSKLKQNQLLETRAGLPVSVSVDRGRKFIGEARVQGKPERIDGNLLYIVSGLNLPPGLSLD